MPARASFMTERYVRDHGVYANWAEVPVDSPTYVWALRAAGYHTSLVGKAHLYRDEILEAKHIDDLAGRLMSLGFAEVRETGDKFMGEIPNRYSDYLLKRGMLDAYQRHIADRSYQGENERGGERHQAGAHVGLHADARPPRRVHRCLARRRGGALDRAVRAPTAVLLVRRLPRPPRSVGRAAGAVDRYRDVEVSMPRSTRRPTTDGTGRYGALLNSFLWLSDTETMTEDAIRGMRRTFYDADISVIDDAVGLIVGALEEKGVLDDTWLIYTSDHGEMGGNHGMMSKCVLYEPAVRVPLILRPPRGCPPGVVDALVEHIDVPATVREIAGAPALPASEGRSLLGHTRGGTPCVEIGVDQRKLGLRLLRDRAAQDRRRRGRRDALPALRPPRRPRRGPGRSPRAAIDLHRGRAHGDVRPTVLSPPPAAPSEHLHGLIAGAPSHPRSACPPPSGRIPAPDAGGRAHLST